MGRATIISRGMDTTIMKYKCTTCSGEYNDTTLDGLQYYHACPPELDVDKKYFERRNKRDENIKTKKEGLGRTEI